MAEECEKTGRDNGAAPKPPIKQSGGGSRDLDRLVNLTAWMSSFFLYDTGGGSMKRRGVGRRGQQMLIIDRSLVAVW